MGCGASTPEDLRDRELQRKADAMRKREQNVHKLLLLGAGESGKSTLFKQMIIIYGNKFSEAERRNVARVIYSNVFMSLRTLAEEVDNYGGCETEEAKAAQEVFQETLSPDLLTPAAAAQAAAFWADAGVQKTYSSRFDFQLTDSTKYFLDKVFELAAADYLPTEQDVLRSRVRTAGIVENEFVIPSDDGEQHIFRMYDVGGQKSERKKWLHCFSGVRIVLFVAAINEWGHKMAEDEGADRMQDAVTLFGTIVNSEFFKTVPVLLFLNKIDLFAERVKQKSIRTAFPEYAGAEYTEGDEASLEAACEDHQRFITDMFLREVQPDVDEKGAVKQPESYREVEVHLTQATDNQNVARIFRAVRDSIIGESMKDAGLF